MSPVDSLKASEAQLTQVSTRILAFALSKFRVSGVETTTTTTTTTTIYRPIHTYPKLDFLTIFSYLVLEGQPASLAISFYHHFWWIPGRAEEMCSFFTNGKGQHCNKI